MVQTPSRNGAISLENTPVNPLPVAPESQIQDTAGRLRGVRLPIHLDVPRPSQIRQSVVRVLRKFFLLSNHLTEMILA